jgi:hypothetical protein
MEFCRFAEESPPNCGSPHSSTTARNSANIITMMELRDIGQLPMGERLARAVLLFYEPGPWTAAKAELWYALTGQGASTTRVLGDLARQVIASEESRRGTPLPPPHPSVPLQKGT